jgi:hypothetical protein
MCILVPELLGHSVKNYNPCTQLKRNTQATHAGSSCENAFGSDNLQKWHDDERAMLK